MYRHYSATYSTNFDIKFLQATHMKNTQAYYIGKNNFGHCYTFHVDACTITLAISKLSSFRDIN